MTILRTIGLIAFGLTAIVGLLFVGSRIFSFFRGFFVMFSYIGASCSAITESTGIVLSALTVGILFKFIERFT